ncbi:pentatricopeptide repeat (PPR) superfamily protein [Artemisia annua]|uniref:Pentatricopeptide repeat (PPR) superfamily protein n=1 Tax=Artemisia annua TaxID=35608 RepID=A0A2U1PTS4_ARTAN|nr:pentatricopeptide repeat (PPR) superfamily protein [Artemisia annua]
MSIGTVVKRGCVQDGLCLREGEGCLCSRCAWKEGFGVDVYPLGVPWFLGIVGFGRVNEAWRGVDCNGGGEMRPTTRTYSVLIKAVCDMGLIDKALCLVDEMVKMGCEPNVHTFTILIDGLCKEGKIDEANGMFRRMVRDGLTPGTVTFNALINSYCKEGRVVSAFELLAMMEKRNSRPNIRTYNELMEGLCRIGKPYKAMTLLRKIIDNGLRPERLTYNILVDGFCKEGHLDMAFRILKSMGTLNLESDGFAYTMLIDRLSKEAKLDQANGLLSVMIKKGIEPDEVTFTALIDGYCKNGKLENAVILLDKMVQSNNLTLTGPHIFNSVIDAFIKNKKSGQENAMLGKMLKHGITPSVVTYTILVDGFCQTGNIKRSLEVFELMKHCKCPPNVYTFTVLIDGFCQNGRLEEVVKLLQTMYNTGVTPNVITYTILIRAYVKFGDLECAFEILNDMINNKCQPNSETLSALLEGLILSKSITSGSLTVFKETGATHFVEFLKKAKKHGVQDSDIYSFWITGLYKVGRILEGDELAQEMVKNGYFPDVSVCSQIVEHLCSVGRYGDCVKWMKLMFDHGIMPSFASYCSIVHGLRKEGKVHEVQDLLVDLLCKAGVEDIDGVITYVESMMSSDEHDECLELLKVVEDLNQQERPII